MGQQGIIHMKVEAIPKLEPIKKRPGQQKKIKGLDMEYCANCGKPIIFSAFMLRSNYRFKDNKRKKTNYYCTYSCMVGKNKVL